MRTRLSRAINLISLAILTLVALPVFANTGMTFHGRIILPNGHPLEASSVNFDLQIRSPGAENCLLFEETQNLTMTGSSGIFVLTIGDGVRVAPAVDGGNSFNKIFENRGTLTLPTCNVGTTYTPNPADGRHLVVQFNDNSGSGWQALPVQDMNFVPLAIEALQVSGYTKDQLLRVADGVTATEFAASDWNALWALIQGTSTVYSKANGSNFSPTSNVNFNGQQITNLGTPTTASMAATKGYVDTNFLGLGGGTLAGSVNLGANSLTNVGHVVIANQGTLYLGKFTNPQEASFIAGPPALGGSDTGRTWYNTTTGRMRYWDGLAAQNVASESYVGAQISVATASMVTAVNGTAGEINSTGGNTPTLSLLATGVAAASYGSSISVPQITVDSKGRITVASNVPISVTGALGYTPVNRAGDTMTGLLVLSADPSAASGAATKQYVDAVSTAASGAYLRKDGTTALTADWNLGNFHISGLLDPVSASYAATKNYVDTKFAGSVTSVSGIAGQTVITGSSAAPTVGLATTGVSGATYGSSTQIPVLTIDSYGRVTSATYTAASGAVASVTGTAGQIQNNGTATNPVMGLVSTGVGAGSYGSLSQIPVITVDSYGRLTAAGSVSMATAVNAVETDPTVATFAKSATGISGRFAINGSNQLDLTSFGVAGTFGSTSQIPVLTLDNYGRVTTASYLTVNDTSKLPLAGGTMSGNINMASYKLTNLGTPSASYDAATKAYVDAQVGAAGTVTSVNAVTGDTVIGGTSAAPTVGLATTSVIAGTYGATDKTLILSVDSKGRLTSASQASIAIAPSQITQGGAANTNFLQWNGSNWAAASFTSSVNASEADPTVATFAKTATGISGRFTSNGSNQLDLASSGVSSGTYGSVSQIPVLTIDAYGRVIAATYTSVPTTTSLSSLTAATASNTIDSANFAQTWNWSTATTQNPMSLTANSLTTGSLLNLTSSSSSLNSTNGLLYVANTTAATFGTVARIQSNSSAGSGMTVLANGNVGVGTTSPVRTLEVTGTGNNPAARFTYASGSAGIELMGNSLSSDYINFGDTGGNTNNGFISFNNTTNVNPGSLNFGTAQTTRLTIGSSGNVGIGVTSPSARLQLPAGAAGASMAPLKFTQGTNLTTPEAGAMEYDGTNLYITDNTNTRRTIATSSSTYTNGSVIAASYGSAAAPGLTFNGDTSTGFFDNGGSKIGITVGGTNLWNITSSSFGSTTTGGALISNSNVGTASFPTYSFAGDTGTGWFRAAPSTLAAATGSTERIRIDSSGNVGIGTTNPNARLSVVNTSGMVLSLQGMGGGRGQISFLDDAGAGAGVIQANTSNLEWNLASSAQSFFITPDGGSTHLLHVNGTGNVGIGTAAPAQLLDIRKDQAAATALKVTNTNANGQASLLVNNGTYGGEVGIYGASISYGALSNNQFYNYTGSSAGITLMADNPSAPIKFASGGSSERMRIDSSGNVGIGTSAPGARLDIGTGNLMISTAAVAPSKIIGSDNSNKYLSLEDGGGGAVFSGYNKLRFQINAADKMVVDGLGNVGIGTTAPTAALHLKAGSATASMAPLKFTQGTNLTTPEAGAMEYDGTNLYITDNTNTRRTLATTSAIAASYYTAGSTIAASFGSASSPGLTFNGDTSTGFFRNGTSTIGLTAGGTNLWNISSSGIASPTTGGALIANSIGTASYPTYSFVGDTGTGWFRAGASTLAAATGGQERMRIDSSGNVGIGTTTPLDKLDVLGAESLSDMFTASVGTVMTGPSTSDLIRLNLQQNVNGGANLVMGGSGGAGGTWSAPTIYFADNKRAYAAIQGVPDVAGVTSNHQKGDLIFQTTPDVSSYALAERMRITNSGNIGIGTTAPAARLNVALNGGTGVTAPTTTSTANTYLQLGSSEYGANSFRLIGLGYVVPGTTVYSPAYMGYQEKSVAGYTYGDLIFGTRNVTTDTSPVERMRIDNSGNVGIGTTAPAGLLDAEKSDTSGIVLNADGTAHTAWVDWRGNQGNNWWRAVAGTSGSMSFLSENTGVTPLTLLNSGNVGIGTSSPTARLQLPAGASTASMAPLKFTSGTNLTTPEAGAVEYDGTNLYVTDNTNTRRTLLTNGSGTYGAGSVIAASYGVAAAPGLTFNGNTDTGFFNTNPNTTNSAIGISVEGTNVWNITSSSFSSATTGGALISNSNVGTASFPTYSFAGDTGTGWFRAAPSTLAAATGGAERMRIDSSGKVSITGSLSVLGSAGGSEQFGANASALGTSSTAVGASALASDAAATALGTGTTASYYSTAVGQSANAASYYSTAVGASSNTSYQSTALGFSANSAGPYSLALGYNSSVSASYSSSIALGYSTFATKSNQFVVGPYASSPSYTISEVVIGQGSESVYANNAGGVLYRGTNGLGTNIAGANLKFAGGSGTGSAAGGYISLSTTASGSSGSALNTSQERMRIDSNGLVGIGTTSPTARLQLPAGASTASMAPLKFTSGTNLTTPEAGAMEYDGTNLYITDNTNTRRTLATTSAVAASYYTAGSTVLASYGSAGSPGLTFNGDASTGFFRSGPGTIGITAGGTNVWNITSSSFGSTTTGGANITNVNGTAAAPTYSFAGDTGTGWFRAAASTLAASTGGSERIRIDSSGNVGIGTTSPAANGAGGGLGSIVQVQGGPGKYGLVNLATDSVSSGAVAGVLSFVSTGSAGADKRSGVITSYLTGDSTAQVSGDLNFYTNNGGSIGNRMRIDNAGNVGIGTSSPGAPLQVTGQTTAPQQGLLVTTNSYTSGTAGSYVRIGHGASSGNTYGEIDNVINGGASYGNLVLQTGGGNVGIGTTGPNNNLEVAGSQTKVGIRNNGAANTNSGINWEASDGSNRFTTYANYDASTWNDTLTFSSVSASNSLVLKGNGNVGIGTASPASKLEVSSNAGGITNGLKIENTNLAVSSFGLFPGTASPDAGLLTFGDGTGWKFHIGKNSDGGATKFMTIQDNGNIGIGTTTASYQVSLVGSDPNGQLVARNPAASGWSQIQVMADNPDIGHHGAGLGYMGSGNTGASMPNTPAGEYGFQGTNGAYPFVLYTNSAGRMIIDGAGNVGIGNTYTPSALLDVEQNIQPASQADFIMVKHALIATASYDVHSYTRTAVYNSISVPNTNTQYIGDQRGAWNLSQVDGSGNVTAVVGTRSWGSYLGTGNATEVDGVQAAAGAGSAGLVTNLNALNASATAYGGKVTNLTGVYVSTHVWSGTVNNRYGIYLEAPNNWEAVSYNDFGIYQPGNQKNVLYGNLGIGITPASYQLQLSTDSAAKPGTSTWTIASDVRLKDIKGSYDRGLAAMEDIHPIYFNYKQGNPLSLPSEKTYVGIKAQDVQKTIPEAVDKDGQGYLHVTNDAVIWTMFNAIKELFHKWTSDSAEIHRELATVKQENADLKKQNEELQQALLDLKNRVDKIEKKK